MKNTILAIASLFAMPVSGSQDGKLSDRCTPMDIMMGAHKAEPVKPERPSAAILSPKPQSERAGPAVLIPGCKGETAKRRRKDDHPLA